MQRGASSLGKLLEPHQGGTVARNLFPKRVFAAHSESDTTANITGIEDLQKVCNPADFAFFRIPKDAGVSHACVVLKDPVYAIDSTGEDEPLEKANPLFTEMLEAIAEFG